MPERTPVVNNTESAKPPTKIKAMASLGVKKERERLELVRVEFRFSSMEGNFLEVDSLFENCEASGS